LVGGENVSFDQSGPDDVAEDRLRAAVESIGDHARSVNLDRADRLSRALAAVAAGAWDEATRREAIDIAHQLVGSAGTFGFPEASQLAGEIERYFVDADLGDPVRLATARDQVRRLTEELAAGPDHQPDEERDEPDPTS
jgi:HPt (histidine-containing phosphotransfer) domain-containing protein